MFTLQTKIIITYTALAALFLVVAAAVIDTERPAIVLIGVAFLLLTVLVSIFVVRQFTKPMTTIADAMKRIRTGDLDTRVSMNGSDEMAVVGHAVNEMVEKLKDDVTQLKKLERVRSEFLGNVSHELRTPIFSMQGFLETLIEGAVDDPNVNRDFLQKAHSHSQRLNTLLGDLITISHIESGEMKMSFRYFNLHEFLCSLVEVFRPTAEHYDVQLKLADGLVLRMQCSTQDRVSPSQPNLNQRAILQRAVALAFSDSLLSSSRNA
jgi:two-component system phosphate regulon sensor histidine kinase PhoR